ncbi:MAG TPA: hypothetical protein VN929_04300 [Burkholderiales bacterium]|nr:hypothetical protein [Burkholderiales bacterium]
MPFEGARFWLHSGTALVFLAITALGWHLWPNGVWGIYSLTDGALAAWNSSSMFAWSRFFDPNPYNFFQGLGSQYLPNTPWLNPGALALSIPGDIHVRYYLSYAIYFMEALISVVLLARTLGFSALQAALAGQAYCLVMFPPYTNYFVTLPWMSLAPFNAHLTAIFNVALVLYKRLGERSHRESAVLAVLIVLMALAAFYTSVITSLTYLPAYGSFAALMIGYRVPGRSLGWKLGVLLGLLALSLVLGLPEYYSAMARVTSSHLLTPVLEPVGFLQGTGMLVRSLRNFDWCAQPQLFLCSRYPVVYVHWVGLIGGAILLVIGSSMSRRLGAGMLIYVAFLHFYAAATKVSLLGAINRISVDFLLFASYTFYVLCAVGGVFTLAGRAQRYLPRFFEWLAARNRLRFSAAPEQRSFLERSAYILASLAVIAAGTWMIRVVQKDHFSETPMLERLRAGPAIYAPQLNPITAQLMKDAALSQGEAFRGLTASYFGGREGPLRKILGFANDTPSATEIYVESRHYLQARYGNSFMMTDLWRFNIPTFEEYGQMVSQPLYVFAKEIFGRPGDTMQSFEINFHRLDIKAMQALGVRFLLTDAELQDHRLRLLVEHQADPVTAPPRPEAASYTRQGKSLLVGAAAKLRLYEIRGANIASFSPTRITRLSTTKAHIDRLRADDFSPAREILVTEAIDQSLVPAEHSKMLVYPGKFRVIARSPGISVVLLPVQFSRCLSLKSLLPERRAMPRLIRANLIQSAVLFERELDAVLSFDFAPGPDRTCRTRDVADLENLDFSPWRLSPTSSRVGILPSR